MSTRSVANETTALSDRVKSNFGIDLMEIILPVCDLAEFAENPGRSCRKLHDHCDANLNARALLNEWNENVTTKVLDASKKLDAAKRVFQVTRENLENANNQFENFKVELAKRDAKRDKSIADRDAKRDKKMAERDAKHSQEMAERDAKHSQEMEETRILVREMMLYLTSYREAIAQILQKDDNSAARKLEEDRMVADRKFQENRELAARKHEDDIIVADRKFQENRQLAAQRFQEDSVALENIFALIMAYSIKK